MITYDQLMLPSLKAIDKLGGSASISEIYDAVVELENYGEDILSVMHKPETSNETELAYRLAWARTYLKKTGYLENSSRGIWALTAKGRQLEGFDSREVVALARSLGKQKHQTDFQSSSEPSEVDDLHAEEPTWREELHIILTERICPKSFERLTQRLLRELGFVHVEVTGRTGDGGIDGKGIARMNGFMSFHIAFQCKKYKGTVSASEIRDFRGATVGRADRGMFITTGRFTKAAIEEASRDGASPIDLVDGNQLADKLKELSLGIKTELVEEVTVEPSWFLNI